MSNTGKIDCGASVYPPQGTFSIDDIPKVVVEPEQTVQERMRRIYLIDRSQIKAKQEIEIQEAIERECGMPPDAVAAMTLWGEARGEGWWGLKGVASVIYRRAMRVVSKKEIPIGLAISEVCLAPHQFSCWADGVFAQEFPADKSTQWDDCNLLANMLVDETFEPTIVATHYHANYVTPYWSKKMQFVGTIGNHLFYKEY